MDLKTYFEKTRGTGVLSTADGQGLVNAAVYARPRVLDDGSLAFIMRDRLTHHNLQSKRIGHRLHSTRNGLQRLQHFQNSQ